MLFVGDDWAEDHHDVEIQDEVGRRLARARLPEGSTGITRLHALIAEHLPDDVGRSGTGRGGRGRVVVGIETDRGTWVAALVAAGYRGVRDQPDVGGPVPGAALDLGREVRRAATRTCWPRSSGWTAPITGRSPGTAQLVEAVKLVARAHQSADLGPHPARAAAAQSTLREFFPAALEAFRRPDRRGGARAARAGAGPGPGGAPVAAKITAALRRARRRDPTPRPPRSRRCCARRRCVSPRRCEAAYAAIVASQVRLIAVLNTADRGTAGRWWPSILAGTRTLRSYLSQPGLGTGPRRPGARRVRRRPGPLRRRQGPQELRRHLTDHPRLRHQTGRAGPLRPQPAPRRRRCTSGPSARSPPHPAPAPTTTPSAPAAPATTPPSASSATASSASSTAASKPAPPTTRTPPGRTIIATAA